MRHENIRWVHGRSQIGIVNIQSWAQRRDSTITFDVHPTLGWNPDTANLGPSAADNLMHNVFALIEHRDRGTIDPLNVEQWLFHVIATRVLDATLGSQKSVSIKGLRRLKPKLVRFGSIDKAIREVVETTV